MYMCPVCFYDHLEEEPTDYNICDCCGTEFGSDDEVRTHSELRSLWIAKGAKWFFRQPPFLWNPWVQLSKSWVKLPFQAYAFTGGACPASPYLFPSTDENKAYTSQTQASTEFAEAA